MRPKWSASCRQSEVFLSDGLVMVQVFPPAGPAERAARSEHRANEFAIGFVRTVRQESLGHLAEKAFDHHVPAMPRQPGVNTQDR